MKKNILFCAIFVLLLSNCSLKPNIDLGMKGKNEQQEIVYTQQKLDIKKDEAKLQDCRLEPTNEIIEGDNVIFSKDEYVKLVKNINAMRACYNNVREKYLLEVEHYNNLIDIINGDYKKE